MNKDYIINQTKIIKEKIGRLPKKRDLSNGGINWSAIYKHFRGLKGLYEAAELDVPEWYFLDKTKLIALHVNDNLTIDELTKITGRSKQHIIRLLDDNRRDFRNEITISENDKDVINGLLLGDGYLTNKSNKSCSLVIGQKYDKYEYLNYLANILPLENSIYYIEPKDNWKAKVINPEYRYYSRTYKFLNDYHEKWYHEVKVIPEDLQINSTTLLHWYIGDGSYGSCVRISSCCFTNDEVDLLIDKLKNIGILSSRSNRNEIYCRRQSTDLFFDIIGECPVECYKYKWPKERHIVTRIPEYMKKEILSLYRNTNYTTRKLSKIFEFSEVAIARLIRMNVSPQELKSLKDIRMMSKCRHR